MFRKQFNILFLMLLLTHFSNAQVVFHTIEEVWKYADAHNISIRTAKYDLQKAEYSKRIAIGNLLPQISATGSGTDNTALQTTLIPAQLLGGPAGVYKTVQFGQKYIYAAGYTAQLDLLNLQSWLNLKISKESEELSRDSLANFRKSVYQQLATQYYTYLIMEEVAKLSVQNELIADSVLKSVNHKFEEGLVNKANVDLAKINLERAKQNSITSFYQKETAKNNLKGLLDLAVKDSIKIDDQLLYNFDAINNPFQEDPSLEIARQATNISLYQCKLVNTGFYPTISLLYSNTTQQNDNKFELFQAGSPQWYPARYWSLRASWLLFNGGGRYYQSKKSKIAFLEKNEIYENLKKQTDINDENLKLAFKKASELFVNAREVMNLSLDNYNHISNRYLEGIASIDDRLNAFSDYINYQNQYLNNMSDLLVQCYLVKIRQLNFK